MIFAQKLTKLRDFDRKMPEFYVIIAQKIFFSYFFFGGGARAALYPRLLRLWKCRLVPSHIP